MSADLSLRTNGTAEMLVADVGAWHNKAEVFAGVFSAKEAIERAIPWVAIPRNVFATLGDGSLFQMNTKGIFRSDTDACIGEVGAGYESIQPTGMFNWVDTIMEGSGYHYESAGALRGGSVLFVSARVGEINVLGSGDVTRTYLAFINSFDGTLKAQAYLTGTRIVCMNTVQMSLRDTLGSMVTFKHTKNVHARMARAGELVQGIVQTQESLQEKLELLAKRVIRSKETYEKILDTLFPGQGQRTKNIKAEVTDIWQDNDHGTFPDWKNTAYSLYNAVTNYVDHKRSTKGDDTTTARFESAILGSGAKLKDDAMRTILTLTDGTELSHVTYFDAPIVSV